MGDPIECESIRQTFGGAHRTQELFLGSVKDNIGHAEGASGVAALIKTLLMMRNRAIPKQANFKALSPKIRSLELDRMAIAKRSQPWASQKLTAVINNYGAAGSNAAILLQEYSLSNGEQVKANTYSSGINKWELPFFISARTAESLRSYCMAMRAFLLKDRPANAKDAITNIAYNLTCKQNRGFEYLWTSTASDLTGLSHQLETAALKSNNLRKTPAHERPIVLCFGGQTGQNVSLSEDLFHNCDLLRMHLVRFNYLLCKLL